MLLIKNASYYTYYVPGTVLEISIILSTLLPFQASYYTLFPFFNFSENSNNYYLHLLEQTDAQ